MKKMKNLLFVLSAATFVFTACQKESGGELLQGNGNNQSDIVAFKKDMKDNLEATMESEGFKGLESVSNTFSGFALDSRKSPKKRRIDVLSKSIDARILSKHPNARRKLEMKDKTFKFYSNFVDFLEQKTVTHRFPDSTGTNTDMDIDFEMLKGVYRYNISTEEYDKVSNNFNGILLQFPADLENRPNVYNGELIISDFSTQKVTFDGESYEAPKSFSMELYISSNKVAGLSFDVTYGNDDIPVTALKLNIFVLPLDFNLNYNYSSTLISVSTNLTNTESAYQLFSAEMNTSMLNSMPTSSVGFAQVGGLKANYQISVPSNTGTSSVNFNDVAKIDVYSYPANNYIGNVIERNDELYLVTSHGDVLLSDLFDVFSDNSGLRKKIKSKKS